jgi:hypothetical protein
LLYLQLDDLFLILEFIQVASVKLYVTQERSPLLYGNDYQIKTKDIPTGREMRLNCSHDLNILKVR